MSYILPKTETIRLFDNLAAHYDDPALRFNAFTADRLIAQLKPHPEDKILDLATGTGHVALSACQMLSSGRVIGIDLSEKMLDKAHEKVQHLKIKNIDLYDMDAENLEFKPDYFNHVVCAFGLPFFSDPVKVLHNCQQIMQTGGRLLFAVWAEAAFQPLLDILQQQLSKYHLQTFMPAANIGMSQQQITAIFQQAGFKDYNIKTQALGYHLQGLADSWDIIERSHLSIALSSVPPSLHTDIKLDFIDQAKTLQSDKGLWLDMQTHFIEVIV